MRLRSYFTALFLLLVFSPLTIHCITLSEEKKYGLEIYQEIARSASINSDPFVSLYLNTMKERLENQANLPFPAVVTIIDSMSLDAFATIGGYVYITTGLIGFADKEEEIAGIIAHEFAHVAKRHIAKRMEKEKYLNIGMMASLVAAMLIPDAKAKEVLAVTGTGAAQTISLKYSREDEEEADRVGSIIANNAGYGGLGIAGFLKKLKATSGDNVLPQYLLTHPYHEERIVRLEIMWQPKEIELDTSFFPYVLVRSRVLHRPTTRNIEDVWINRYKKDKDDPLKAYAAALIYALKGDADESIKIASAMKTPYRNTLLGEILVDGRRYGEAIDILKNESSPVARFYLARAYEGSGERVKAAGVMGGILRYGSVFPEIYYRYGMLMGRMGNEAGGYEYLGRHYVETGKTDLARTYLEKAVAKYGINSREAKEVLSLLEEMEAGK